MTAELTREEKDAWTALFGVLVTLPGALDARLRREAGITSFDYTVLYMLSEAPDHTLRMSELAHRTSSSLSRLSHVVAKLEARGWVRRHPCPEDGRVTLASLVDEGLCSLGRVAPGHVAAIRALVFDGLDDEDVADLRRVAQRMLERLDPARALVRR